MFAAKLSVKIYNNLRMSTHHIFVKADFGRSFLLVGRTDNMVKQPGSLVISNDTTGASTYRRLVEVPAHFRTHSAARLTLPRTNLTPEVAGLPESYR